MNITSKVVTSLAVLAGVAMAVMAGGVQASAQGAAAGQQPPPSRTRVATVQVKPEMQRAWLEMQRAEVVPALKKAGVAWRWVFSNGGPVGPGFTYTIVQPVTNYAQFDLGNSLRRGMTPEAFTRYQDKERTMVTGTSAVVRTLLRNASIVSGSSTPPAIAVVQTVELLQGKGQEFAALTASDYVPAMKKAGATDYWVFATNFGGSQTQRTIVTPHAKWAELDAPSPLQRALGPEGAQKLNQKRGLLLASSELSVVAFVPEASYGAPPPPPR